ncbi:MAG: helix-hairpin-helix domain-containing protein [Flavobacteriales bacterium]|nr:helix-hairpin-helix domain-containing protein [Flavobacteriales bacterium]
MLEDVKAYFVHYKSERRGVIVFATILFSIYLVIEIFAFLYTPKIKEFDLKVMGWENLSSVRTRENSSSPAMFGFNPNELSDSGYKALGFSEKEIQTLRNYQRAGAFFEVKKDFQKLFFVDSVEYKMLEPFIQLPDSLTKKSPQNNSYDKQKRVGVKWSDTASYSGYEYKPFACNINTADTTELKMLKGVGSFYARMIVERREKLGGYHNMAQLLEIWKMTPDKIDKFAHQVEIDVSEVRRIDINHSTASELSKHPYLDFGLSSKIILKREELGRFNDSVELCESGLLDAELCRKLAPYLKFD